VLPGSQVLPVQHRPPFIPQRRHVEDPGVAALLTQVVLGSAHVPSGEAESGGPGQQGCSTAPQRHLPSWQIP
jgi:hypothetical protein